MLAPLVIAACASGAPPSLATPALPSSVAPAASPDASASIAPVADSSPTVLTTDEQARDAARAPLAKAIVGAFTNFAPRRSPDGKKLLFGSRRDGNRQYYLADLASPSSPPVALTRNADRATAATFALDGKSVLFLRDSGADENDRIYRVDLDGANETCLTPGAVRRRSLPFQPKKAPGLLVYSERDVKAVGPDIVTQTIGGAPKVVYTDPSSATLRDVTSDGKRALLRRRYSPSDQVLLELDLATGKTRRLYPAEGKKVVMNTAVYSPDGKRAYVACDDGADGELLLAIDVASGAIKQQYRQVDPPTGTIGDVLASPRGDRLAIVIDAGDHAEARILDAKTLAVTATVHAPLGAISLTRFSDDGKTIGATVTTADAPTDAFSVDVATGAVEPLRHDERPGLASLEPMETTIESTKAFAGLSIPLLVYLPKGARASGKRLPVIVDFHGGPMGSAAIGWDPWVRFFNALGYAFVEPNVRGSTGYGRAYEMADNREKRADWLRDVESVNAWARAQAWADSNRLVVSGASYGGYTVLMALTRQSTMWRAGVDYVGIANLLTFLRATDQAIRSAWVDEFGDLEKDKPLLEAFSPIHDVGKITAPLFVYAGQNDTRVPREESDQVVQALRARGVPVEYEVAANEGHSMDHKETRVELLTRVARFLEDHAQ